MQTALPLEIRQTHQGQLADQILRSCVHCGFCNATCPTYQLLGDELDGPRGRIYLIKQTLEGAATTAASLQHLDRCLTCRNCEITCPSGVQYSRLLDIGRELIEQRVKRSPGSQLARWLVRHIVPYRQRFAALLNLGQLVRKLMPTKLHQKIPHRPTTIPWPQQSHSRRMLVLEGCVQPLLAPSINASVAQLLDRLGISAIRVANEVCCGAASHHTSGQQDAKQFARKNIDAWWPYVEQGIEAIISTASGCGVHVKDYHHLLEADATYATKAKRISEITKDISEVLSHEQLERLKSSAFQKHKIAFHSPCTLQHGQKINGLVEKLLQDFGHELIPVNEPHLCCGSAGTYSLLQPNLATLLRDRKLSNLQKDQPQLIATANIGCMLHLQNAASVPVKHWIELLVQPI